jgi:hypothetical protein
VDKIEREPAVQAVEPQKCAHSWIKTEYDQPWLHCEKCGGDYSTLPAQAVEPEPPFDTKRKAAMAIYKPPFKHHRGYIYDSQQHMVADDHDVHAAVVARVRGWGRIGYMQNPEELQDEVGEMMADALNALYTHQAKPLSEAQIDQALRNHYNPHDRPHISFARAIEAAHGIKGTS